MMKCTFIHRKNQQTVISSDDENEANVTEEVEKESEPEPIANLHHDDCDAINVDYDKRLSRHDDPFGGMGEIRCVSWVDR